MTRTAKKSSIEDMTIRELIDQRLEELGVSRWRFAHSEDLESVSPSTTFRFLRGEHDAMGESVEAMLRACGLKVVPTRKLPRWVKRLRVG